jgi:hypothetical protein
MHEYKHEQPVKHARIAYMAPLALHAACQYQNQQNFNSVSIKKNAYEVTIFLEIKSNHKTSIYIASIIIRIRLLYTNLCLLQRSETTFVRGEKRRESLHVDP